MTLIACTRNFDVPFLTSDILMSSATGSENFQIPTNNFDINPLLSPDNPNKPDSFAQKMYIPAANVCVMFAGSAYEIKKFLIDFRIWCNIKSPVSETHVKEFLDNYDLPNKFSRSALFIIVMSHSGEDSVHVGMFNFPKEMSNWMLKESTIWQYLTNEVYEVVYASGSGRYGFLNIIHQKVNFFSRHEKGSIWYAIQSNVSLIARTLALEKITLNTLKENYGGGFETAFYNGLTFEKLSNIVYVAAYKQFELDGNIDIPFPQLFLYCNYIGDVFRIIAIEVQRARKEIQGDKVVIVADSIDLECRCFDVEMLDAIPSDVELPTDYSFKTSNVAIGYSLVGPDNGIYNPCLFNQHPELTVTYEHGHRLEFIQSLEVHGDVNRGFQDYFARTYKSSD